MIWVAVGFAVVWFGAAFVRGWRRGRQKKMKQNEMRKHWEGLGR